MAQTDPSDLGASRQSLLRRAIHIGSKQLCPCPVGQKWRIAVFADPGELTRDQLDQAAANRV
jgi:hypothetical protein